MSPWVFYAIDVIQSLRIVMIITASLSTLGWVMLWSTISQERFVGDTEKTYTLILFVTSAIAAILALFLPSFETTVQMLVAVTGTDIDHIRQIEEVTKAILGR